MIVAMAAALGGIDALVFTGGMGENAATVRAAACECLRLQEVAIDARRNEPARPDATITVAGSRVEVLVIAAREDAEIAAQVRRLLAADAETARKPQQRPTR